MSKKTIIADVRSLKEAEPLHVVASGADLLLYKKGGKLRVWWVAPEVKTKVATSNDAPVVDLCGGLGSIFDFETGLSKSASEQGLQMLACWVVGCDIYVEVLEEANKRFARNSRCYHEEEQNLKRMARIYANHIIS